jgi:dTDP-4-dehydrorhamnose reductase
VSPVRVLLTGASGLVGTGLLVHAPGDVDVTSVIHSNPLAVDCKGTIRLDLLDRTAVLEACERVRPDVIIHAAYAMSEDAIVGASRHVAEASAAAGANMIHLSSDVVFAGTAESYAEHDPPDPVSRYGTWKRDAEQVVIAARPDAAIVRTSLVACIDPPDHTMRWFAGAIAERRPLVLFGDEVRAPVLLADLASAIWAIVALPTGRQAGPWHLVGPEAMSRVEHGGIVLGWLSEPDAEIVVGSAADAHEPRPRRLALTCERAVAELSYAPQGLGTVAPHGPLP